MSDLTIKQKEKALSKIVKSGLMPLMTCHNCGVDIHTTSATFEAHKKEKQLCYYCRPLLQGGFCNAGIQFKRWCVESDARYEKIVKYRAEIEKQEARSAA